MAVHAISEHKTVVIDVGAPSIDDLRLADELNADFDRKVELRWLHDGRLEVRSNSWVGVLHLSCATIHIRPKLAGDELGLVRMIEYASRLSRLKYSSVERTLDASSSGLLDLLCALLATETEAILRDGLLHSYTTEEDALPALRGSLRFREQATKRFGQLDVLECRFDEFHADVFDNQFLSAGIAAAARVASSTDTRKRLRRLEQNLAQLTSTGPHDSRVYLDRQNYTRQNERYRSAHELCLILIDRLGVDDVYKSGKTRSFSFLLNMNDIFEAFVAAMVDEAFADEPWKVTASKQHRSVIRDVDKGKTYSNIIPDIVLTNGHEVVPFDCKYKLYADKKVSTGDIYQSFVYAYSLSHSENPRAGIIYPAESAGVQPRLGISKIDGPIDAELTGLAINLADMVNSLGDRDGWASTLSDVRDALNVVLDEPMKVS